MSGTSLGGGDPQAGQIAADEAQLAALGYKQQLTRTLSLWDNFSVGFTYLSPVVGVYTLFAFGLATGGPAFFWTIPIVVIGQLLVLLTFSEVASEYPVAGGIYQWARRLVGDRYAWFAWWFYTWALLITLASAAFAAVYYVGPLFGFEGDRTSQIITALVILAIGALVNLSGTRNMAIVARLGFVAEIGGSVVVGIIILINGHLHSISAIFETAGTGKGGYVGPFLAAMLFSVFIFYGFEACGDIAEEVVDPSRKVPKAMRMTLLVGGGAAIFITLSYLLAVPSYADVVSGKDADPIGTVLSETLGTVGTKIALALVVMAFISAILAIQTATSRLLYSFARDGQIIGHRFMDRISPRFHIPPGAVLVSALIPAGIVFMPTATVTRIITFATVGLYVGFQSVVLAVLIAKFRGWKPQGNFNLGRWGLAINIGGLIWGVFAIVVLCVKTPALGSGFFDKWLVPVSLAVIGLLGLVYVLIFNPRYKVEEEARSANPSIPVEGDPALETS
jgi:amino acid transporter